MAEQPHRVACAEEDLIKHGQDYVAGLPHPNVSAVGDSLAFAPNWSEATGMSTANLSYCFYSFAVPGFDDPDVLGDLCYPRVAASANGKPHLVFYDNGEGAIKIAHFAAP